MSCTVTVRETGILDIIIKSKITTVLSARSCIWIWSIITTIMTPAPATWLPDKGLREQFDPLWLSGGHSSHHGPDHPVRQLISKHDKVLTKKRDFSLLNSLRKDKRGKVKQIY